MSLSRSLIGSSRSIANAFVTPKYASRSSTAAHHAASITGYAQTRRPALLGQHLQPPPHRPSPGRMGFSAGARLPPESVIVMVTITVIGSCVHDENDD